MKNWSSVALGDIFDIARGGSPRPIQSFITSDSDGINWIMIGDASDNSRYITSTKKRIIRSGVSKSRMVNPGDFLLTNSMSFGHPYILKTSGCIHDGWLVLSAKKNNIEQNYFYHLLGSNTVYREFSRRAAGTTVKNLNIDLVRGVEVSLPPLEEQKRIAAILDKADAIRRKRKEAIALTEELLRSTFLDMFGDPVTNPKGWDSTTLGKLTTFMTSGSRGWAKYYSEKGRLFLRIQNVKDGQLLLNDIAFVNPPDCAETRRTQVQEGDVIISVTADLGRTAVIPSGLPTSHINQHLVLVRIDQSKITPSYLAAFLSSIGGQIQFDRLNREGVKAGLNFDDIKSLNILVPPLIKQKEYLSLKNIQSKLFEEYKEGIDHSDFLFNSLLQKAFCGKL